MNKENKEAYETYRGQIDSQLKTMVESLGYQLGSKMARLLKAYLIRSYGRLEQYIELKRIYDILYDIQEVRKATRSREEGLPMGSIEPLFSVTLLNLEKRVANHLQELLEPLREYKEIFEPILGVGPRISGGFIANIMIRYVKVTPEELEKCSEVQQNYKQKTKGGQFMVPTIRSIFNFATVSKLRSWCGYGMREDGTAPRRIRGKKLKFDDRMQVLCWKTRKQFVLQGDIYRKLYDEYKEFYTKHSKYAIALTDPEMCPRYEPCRDLLFKRAKELGRKPKKFPCKGHINKMAERKTIKDFLRDIYVAWWKLEGIPPPPPYDPNHKHHGED